MTILLCRVPDWGTICYTFNLLHNKPWKHDCIHSSFIFFHNAHVYACDSK